VTIQRFQVALAMLSLIGSLQYAVIRNRLLPCAYANTLSGVDGLSVT